MTARSRLVAVTVLAAALAYAQRTRLVHLLTRATGTWVGAPDD